MQKKEELCHALTSNLRKVRKVQLGKTEQAQTTTRKAPPGAAHRSILKFTTEDYSRDIESRAPPSDPQIFTTEDYSRDIKSQAPPSGPQITDNYTVSYTQVVDRNSLLVPCNSKINKKK